MWDLAGEKPVGDYGEDDDGGDGDDGDGDEDDCGAEEDERGGGHSIWKRVKYGHLSYCTVEGFLL